MKRFFLIFTFLCYGINIYSQSFTYERMVMNQILLKKHHGRVKSCVKTDSSIFAGKKNTRKSFFDENGNQTKEVFYNNDNKTIDYTKYYFYKNNLLIKDSSILSVKENVLDENNRVIYYRVIRDKDTSISFSYQYDNNGKLISTTYHDGDSISRIEYAKYLPNGFTERCIILKKDAQYYSYNKIIILNDSAYTINKTIRLMNNDTISIISETDYKDYMIWSKIYFREKNEEIMFYKKDSIGNITCISEVKDGDCVEEYRYTYDEYGNILTKLCYKYGKLRDVYEYIYEYWE